MYENEFNKQLVTGILEDIIFKHLIFLPQTNIYNLLQILFYNNNSIIASDELTKKSIKQILKVTDIIIPLKPQLAANYLDTLIYLTYFEQNVMKEN